MSNNTANTDDTDVFGYPNEDKPTPIVQQNSSSFDLEFNLHGITVGEEKPSNHTHSDYERWQKHDEHIDYVNRMRERYGNDWVEDIDMPPE